MKNEQITHTNEAPDLVSIIIVTYNAGAYLQRCLNSIRQQVYPSLEVVIIDGCSTDNTVATIKDNGDLVNFWLSEKDEGIYDAMNKGLQHIHGDWVYFLGADDVLFPEFSEFLHQGLRNNGMIYYGGIMLKGIRYCSEISPYNQAKRGICHQAIVYPLSVFKKYGFDERYKISADYYLNMQCYADNDFNFMFLPYTIVDFNHTGISSLHQDLPFEKNKFRYIYQHFGLVIWLRCWFRHIRGK